MKPSPVTISFAIGLIAATVFPGNPTGINLFIFETLLLAALVSTHSTLIQLSSFKTALTGTVVSLLVVLIVHTTLAFCVHTLFVILLSGQTQNRSVKNKIFLLGAAFEKIPAFVLLPFTKKEKTQPSKKVKPAYIFRLSVIPLLIILVFIGLYTIAVPRFSNLLFDFLDTVAQIFPNINATQVSTFIWGTLVAGFFLLVLKKTNSTVADEGTVETMERRRKKQFLQGLPPH